jgi:GNAT superfamily N-acetyltransferase
MREITVRTARPEEAPALSELALRSKGYWGYDAAFLEACRAELTIDPATIGPWRITVAEVEGCPAGLSALSGDGPEGELELLFIEPEMIGSGVGRVLFERAVETAAGAGIERIRIEADPGAEGFYQRMGAVRIGEAPSGSIAGRELPVLVFTVRGE